jgi:hypothetical protein
MNAMAYRRRSIFAESYIPGSVDVEKVISNDPLVYPPNLVFCYIRLYILNLMIKDKG